MVDLEGLTRPATGDDPEVAAVGDEDYAILRHHDAGRRREQAGEVRDIRQGRDEERVQRRLAQLMAEPRLAREV